MAFDKNEVYEVIRKNRDLLYYIAQRFKGSLKNYDIEDIYLEVVIAFYNAADYYDEQMGVSFLTVAYQNAMRRLGNIVRAQNAVKRKADKVINYDMKVGEGEVSYGEYYLGENLHQYSVENKLMIEHVLLIAKEALSESEYSIFCEFCKGHTTKEIAKILNLNEKTTSNKMYVIKNKLKRAVKI